MTNLSASAPVKATSSIKVVHEPLIDLLNCLAGIHTQYLATIFEVLCFSSEGQPGRIAIGPFIHV